MSKETIALAHDGAKAVTHDLRNLDKVRGIFASLAKFVNARAIYQGNNPNFIKSARAFEQSFRSYFETESELVLTLTQYAFVWRDQVVYDIGSNTESLAFLLYKDGIGEITIRAAVGRAELEQLADIFTGALYHPSSQFDTASAFWQAEFPNIFHRVLDEPTDGAGGDGDGSSNTQREHPLRAGDHQDLAPSATIATPRHSDASLEPMGSYFSSVIEQDHPGLNAADTEAAMQCMLAARLAVDPHELAAWTAPPRAGHEGDELIVFLRIILEFTGMRCSPPVIRDINDTIERLVHYIRDEGHVRTLTATLELVACMDAATLEVGFASLPDRVEAELTDSGYLLSLARGLRGNNPHDVLRYLSLASENAIPGLCELLAHSSDTALHEKACDVLFGMAGDKLEAIVDQFDVENPLLASDVIQLLSRAPRSTIPAVIHRIISSHDPRIRRCAVEYLVHVGTEQAARLFCGLLKDGDPGVRVRAFATLERFNIPLVVDEITALCFAEDALLKSSEELEQMFRALGKAAGVAVLPLLRHAVEKKHYLPSGKARSKRDKLCAIAALRYIPGPESHSMLERLSHDSDSLVKTKALHVLKQANGPGSDVHDQVPASAGTEERP